MTYLYIKLSITFVRHRKWFENDVQCHNLQITFFSNKQANLFNRYYTILIVFHYFIGRWTFDLFKTGYTQDLGPEDLYTPLQTDKSSMLGDRLERFVIV